VSSANRLFTHTLDGSTLRLSSRFRISSVGPRVFISRNRSRVFDSSNPITRKYPQPSLYTAGGASTKSNFSHTFHGLSRASHVHFWSMKIRASAPSTHLSTTRPAFAMSRSMPSRIRGSSVGTWRSSRLKTHHIEIGRPEYRPDIRMNGYSYWARKLISHRVIGVARGVGGYMGSAAVWRLLPPGQTGSRRPTFGVSG